MKAADLDIKMLVADTYINLMTSCTEYVRHEVMLKVQPIFPFNSSDLKQAIERVIK